jgi:TRAP-type mannitol/chloroaromatic compound transport system substrate-binding protein
VQIIDVAELENRYDDRRLGDPDYAATGLVNAWLDGVFRR